MKKSDIASHVASHTSLSWVVTDPASNAVFTAITDTLAKGETVAITGFRQFTTRTRAAREGRSPRTLERSLWGRGIDDGRGALHRSARVGRPGADAARVALHDNVLPGMSGARSPPRDRIYGGKTTTSIPYWAANGSNTASPLVHTATLRMLFGPNGSIRCRENRA